MADQGPGGRLSAAVGWMWNRAAARLEGAATSWRVPSSSTPQAVVQLAAKGTTQISEARAPRPQNVQLHQLPVTTFADWDRVGQIRNVLRSYENSADLVNAALLADAMMRDDRIFGVCATRQAGLVGTPLKIRPATSKRKAQRIAEEVAGSDEQAGLWDTMFPPSVVAELSHWGNMLGIAVAQIVWITSAGRWLPTLRVWHPEFLRWDPNLQRYFLRTAEGEVPLPNTEEQPRSDGRWLIWTPNGFRNVWRRSLLRPLAMPYLCRQWSYRDWARYNEVHGCPTPKLKTPGSATTEEQAAALAMLANRGGDAALLLPQGTSKDEPGYDVELLEALGDSHESFEAAISKYETDIAIAVLGQNLSTEVQEGSRAAAEVHDGVRLDKRREDAAIAQCLREQVLTYWALYNYGDAELAPVPEYQTEPPEDELREVQVLAGLGDAVMALQHAGVHVDSEALADRYGVPFTPRELAEEEEEGAEGAGAAALQVPGASEADQLQLTPTAVAAIVKVNEARKAKGLGPLLTAEGAPHPDGELTIAEYQAKNAQTVADAAKAEKGTAPGETPPPPPGGGPFAPKPKEALRAITLLSRTAAGQRRAAKYSDAVIESARRRASRALRVDLAALRKVIDEASDPRDLRRRLVALYRGQLHGRELEQVVKKANLLAHLAGRGGALEDV